MKLADHYQALESTTNCRLAKNIIYAQSGPNCTHGGLRKVRRVSTPVDIRECVACRPLKAAFVLFMTFVVWKP